LLGQLGYFGDLLVDYLQLPLPFLQLQIDHLYFFFFFPDLLLSVLKYVFLNVRLLVKNTQFVVAVNQLDSHEVSLFTCLLVVKDEAVHLFLQAVDD